MFFFSSKLDKPNPFLPNEQVSEEAEILLSRWKKGRLSALYEAIPPTSQSVERKFDITFEPGKIESISSSGEPNRPKSNNNEDVIPNKVKNNKGRIKTFICCILCK